MLVTRDSNHILYHVILVDVRQNGQTLRSFATSEQLIAWLNLHPGKYTLVTNLKGAKLSTGDQTFNVNGAYYNVSYYNTVSDPEDVLCDQDIIWYGVTATPHGTSGWG
jgi:hypothetical protein